MSEKKEWFSEWFDSPYYHILYQNRDDKEAEFFLSNLVEYLQLKPKASIIDLACGKGRHSIYLNSMGFDVTGVDLSRRSIAEALKYSNTHLHFEVQDLRRLNLNNSFDVAVNLFTSLGYFNSKEEDELVIRNIYKSLNPGGIFVIDFMNSELAIQNLVEKQSKTIDGIQFHMSKWFENDFIFKKIHVNDGNDEFEFTEKVQALTCEDFETMLTSNNFFIKEMFGNYKLQAFKKGQSERLIIIAQKHA